MCHQTSTKKGSHTDVWLFCYPKGRCSLASKRDAPETARSVARHHGSCVAIYRSLHPTYVTWNAKQICGTIDFGWTTGDIWRTQEKITHRQSSQSSQPSARARLESGTRNTKRSDARRGHGVNEFTKLRRPFKRVPSSSSTKTHVVCDYTRQMIRARQRRTNVAC